ncbi:endonuclease/exonuclease/phosphatase family protein [Psychromarinibacter sp. C21-152]|uniref:Endonuclease/exonuclease/phosphatase family protein n=1 Tax=Psychromarinibacter sediminicola TaxID=3033385 RepID=A0AAE3TBJ7_9RHOB|nr:endonuclease/exonuclease/phosphatase family protein [Psychromarinibacter sediminicola]MDF0603099.1 endonuclease/exonuclease/phosphatase family protein [Psychromarinibacter sediminicola]
MRRPVTRAIAAMTAPSPQERDAAAAARGSAAAHAEFMAAWPCLSTVEVAQPPGPARTAEALTVAAWNIERCKNVAASAALIRRAGADVVLATEMDHGMARSGQRHTTRDLAEAMGVGYAFGTEFVELGAGDLRETEVFGDTPNAQGLHGNALLSRWPLREVALIPLDDGGGWFLRAPKNDGQYRVGGRMAMGARIDMGAGPLTLASVHLESESDAAGRQAQIARLLETLDALYGAGPAVVGGDLNTRDLGDAGPAGPEMLPDPAAVEPCFATFAAHGFDWRHANTGATTTRLPPWAPRDRPLRRLDWLFTRGVTAGAPAVVPALSEDGDYLSDHELVSARITP